MAQKKPGTNAASEWIAFDLLYEDGTRLSNRRVPASALGGLDGDESGRLILEAEDRRIGELSGRPRAKIKTMTRSKTRGD